jgi:hypothetical protein
MARGRKKGYHANPDELFRKCSTCGETKARTTQRFYAAAGWFRRECIGCTGIRNACTKYGISPEQYPAIVEQQGGGCAICGDQDYGRRSGYALSIDHDHDTGVVRGLLCARCNLAVGYLRNSPELCRRAGEYLDETQEINPRKLQPQHGPRDAEPRDIGAPDVAATKGVRRDSA